MTTKRIFNSFIVLSVLLAAFFLYAPAGAETLAVGVNLDQWANAPSNAWQNGNLNGSNSTYSEGDVVPFRLAIEGLTPGTHTIKINYDFTSGGQESYDFLATYDASESPDLCAAGGGGVSSLCPALPAADTEAFPSDPFEPQGDTQTGLTVAGAEALFLGTRNLTAFGATIDSISGPTHDVAAPVTGNSTGEFLVTFTTDPACTAEPCAVLLAWGGHLAQSAYWKTPTLGPNGAGTISGAPFHMRTLDLDDSGAKNQDRSIQPGSLQTYLELIKDLTATLPPASTGTFNLFIQEDAGTADQVGTDVQDYASGPQPYDISDITPFTFYEEGFGTTDLAWYWTTIVCRDRNSNTIVGQTPVIYSETTITIDIVPGQDIVCTITNADVPTAVSMVSRSVEAGDSVVAVRWETQFESALGFKVLRSESASSVGTAVSGLIAAEGLGGAGASYEFFDTSVKAGKTYFYWVQAVDGSSNFAYGPMQATLLHYLRLPLVMR